MNGTDITRDRVVTEADTRAELAAAQYQKDAADRRWRAAELESLAASRFYEDAEARLRHALAEQRRAVR